MKGRTRHDTGVAPFLIRGSVHHSAYLTPADSAGTHRAWLYGDIECGVRHIFASQCRCGRGNRLHLGMGCDIGKSLGEIVSSADNASAGHYHSSDGYFVGLHGPASLVKGCAHPSLVISRMAYINSLSHNALQ